MNSVSINQSKRRVLLIGSGGREHAMAIALKKSPNLETLYCYPSNAGINKLASKAPFNNLNEKTIITFCQQVKIDTIIFGPEAPLVEGLSDACVDAGLVVFGCSKKAAQLEGSKGFTKDICREMNIPTADYVRTKSEQKALEIIEEWGAPIVIKADGLAAGKGVVVAMHKSDAIKAVKDSFSGEFGEAGKSIVIEKFLEGIEASFFVLTDGKNIKPLATAQDYKRAFDNNQGSNTGGMGAITPSPLWNAELEQEVIDKIINPTLDGLNKKGITFKGVMYAGLMITSEGAQLIEYNVRFGDPEAQIILPFLETDFLDIVDAIHNQTLDNLDIKISNKSRITVVYASKGYPKSYEKNTPINLPEDVAKNNQWADGTMLIHAGTDIANDQLVAVGGRVLNIVSEGENIEDAREKAYKAISTIDWNNGFYRTDIGK